MGEPNLHGKFGGNLNFIGGNKADWREVKGRNEVK